MSAHNPEVIYFCGNRVFKSYDRGDSWPVHSPDLTTRDEVKIAGNVPHCTITTIDESTLNPGLLIVGTDDGLVHMTRDGGYDWSNMTGQFPGAPSGWWVSRATLSAHDESVAYVSFTGYREDDFRPLIYRTDALGSGKGWTLITAGLPAEGPVNDVVEDPRDPDVLYAGTEFGVHVSCDAGKSWVPSAAGSRAWPFTTSPCTTVTPCSWRPPTVAGSGRSRSTPCAPSTARLSRRRATSSRSATSSAGRGARPLAATAAIRPGAARTSRPTR